MVKLHFKNTSEFEGIFKRTNMKVTDAIVLGIEKAMQSAQTSAMLFSITFDDDKPVSRKSRDFFPNDGSVTF